MIHNLIATAPSIWPRIGLVFFLIFFAAVLIWALHGKRDRFEHMRTLPLDKDPAFTEAASVSKGVSHD
jgi:cbb3-type cytochrome oxidase subunit 3